MSQEHIFLLGKNKALSIAEIIMYYKHKRLPLKTKMISTEAMIVESENVPDADFLGGTLKIIKINDQFDSFDPFLIDAPKNIKEENGKAVFGVSVYGKPMNWINRNRNSFRILQKNIKDILKKKGIKSRFLNFRGEINNVHLSKKDVNDIVLYFTGDAVYVGITESFSNPLEYKKRDEKKPVTVSTMGIPIRLAKIMLNMAGVHEDINVLDPFCGSGIILQEAALMGASIMGSDIDPKIVEIAKKNLKWLFAEYGLEGYNMEDLFFISDAARISGKLKSKVDVIVTEPYFGPAIRKMSSKKTAKNMINKIVISYNDAMKEFSRVIKKGGYLCIIVPSYRTKEKNIHMNFRKIFTRYGFETVTIREGLEQPFREEKKTLTREIFLLVKK